MGQTQHCRSATARAARGRPRRARRVAAVAVAALVLMTMTGTGYGFIPVYDGPCGELDAELTDASPHIFTGTIGIYACYFLPEQLSPGGAAILAAADGGSSTYAEIASYELLDQCEDAVLLKTGDEVSYLDAGGKKTDALVEIGGVRIGLMVKRGVTYPLDSQLTLPQAQQLLESALDDVVMSSANVAPADAWQKQILVVETTTAGNRDVLALAYQAVDAALRGDTIVWIVHTTVAFELAERGPATLRVFDVAGRLVRTLVDGIILEAGRQDIEWDGRDRGGRALASGTYIYRLDAGGRVATRRMVLAR